MIAATQPVCQHYHDFLNRHPDPAGQAFWTGQIASCGADAACLAERRENVSTAFLLSLEFQQTGYFVIRAHKATFGHDAYTPRYTPFLADTQEIGRGVVVGQPGFEAQLEVAKQRYIEQFVNRRIFQIIHGGRDAGQYVDALFAGTRVTPTEAERQAALDAFGGGGPAGQARALRSVIESGSVYNKLYNPAFVTMQYFGYLRRNPHNPPDDFNVRGYNFWLAKLDSFSLPGDDVRDPEGALARVKRAEMVKSFINSAEYRGRFHGDPRRGRPFGGIALLRGVRGWREAVARMTRPGLYPALDAPGRALRTRVVRAGRVGGEDGWRARPIVPPAFPSWRSVIESAAHSLPRKESLRRGSWAGRGEGARLGRS